MTGVDDLAAIPVTVKQELREAEETVKLLRSPCPAGRRRSVRPRSGYKAVRLVEA